MAVESERPRGPCGRGLVGPLLLLVVVSAACAAAAVGLWQCSRRGYLTAGVIVSINLVGDTTNVVIAHDWRTLIGLPIGPVMIAYLVKTRRVFDSKEAPNSANLGGG